MPLLTKLVRGSTKQVAASAQAVLALLQQRGGEELAREVSASMEDAAAVAPNLVAQLSHGNKPARRAAFLLDKLARSSEEAQKKIVSLGAVPKLVKMLRNGAFDSATLNALGALEVLASNHTTAQDEARECGDLQGAAPAAAAAAGGAGRGAPIESRWRNR